MRFLITSLLLLLLFSFQTGLAQRTEVGFGLGTFNYTGDLARTYNFANSKPAATVFYRSNLSRVISFRAALTGGKLGASDKRPIDPAAALRNASFNITLLELSTVMEYHFMDWQNDKRIMRFSPYLFAGVGLFTMAGNSDKAAEYSNVQGIIPFGLGVKYVLNPKWYVALEFGMRKTFFDYLDNVSGGDGLLKDYKYGNPNDNDHYYFLGVTLTRTFYSIPCPSSPY